jgi:tRNA(fMet)-specific endonuclease VapC
MRIALDTNRYTDFVRSDAAAVKVFHAATRVYLPFAVLGELRAGFAGGSRGRANEAILTKVLASSRVEVIYPDQETTHHYAAIYQQLRRQGTPVPANDLWISALVVQHGLILFTRDRHFDHLPQIARI